jgi:hypothetical protein
MTAQSVLRQCISCEYVWTEDVAASCPNCNSGNWVYGYIDEGEPMSVINQAVTQKCRSIFHHPQTQEEVLALGDRMNYFKSIKDADGVWLTAMQLITWKDCKICDQFKKK